MKKWIIILMIVAISATACAQKSAPQAEAVVVPPTEAPAPQSTRQQVMVPLAGGSNHAAAEADRVSPVVKPVSPVREALKTEIGGGAAMDTAKLDDSAAAMVKRVIDHFLAKNATLAVDDVQVLQATAQQWRNSSLGCPKEGMMYAQVITPGYLIEVKVGGKVYEYHTDTNQSVALCAVDGQAVK